MGWQAGLARGLGRALAAALVLGVLGSAMAPAPAGAWEYPLLPHVHGLAFFPERPHSQAPTSILLSAVYPNECWHLVAQQLVDSNHVRVTIAPGSDCGDSVSTWSAAFELGVFSPGVHLLTVHCSVLQDGAPPIEEEISIPFEVAAGPSPPPPPPGMPLLQSIGVIPVEPQPGEPVQLRLSGFRPWSCTIVRDAHVLDPANVEITFEWRETCEDTSRTWDHTFQLGGYPAGTHEVQVALHLVHPESLFTVVATAVLRVGVVEPPPPPPPGPGQPLLRLIDVVPAQPSPGESVQLHLSGFTPWECTIVGEPRVVDPANVELAFEWREACEDTSRAWARVVQLGGYPEGTHQVLIAMRLASPESTATAFATAVIQVGIPEPPPPPEDSMRAVLSVSHPNPFSQLTQFGVSLAEPTDAEVNVYDLAGRHVAMVHRGPLPRGTSVLAWDGRRRDGSRAPGGIYFYQLALPGRFVTRRVVLLESP